jgi:hypothetical protein
MSKKIINQLKKSQRAREREREQTKYVDSKLGIYWREKTINKVNEPPGYVEGHRYRKENYTENTRKRKKLHRCS